MDMEIEGTKVKRFGAGVYAHGSDKNMGEDAENSPSYHRRGIFTWENGKQTVANGELFGICEALNAECEEGETDLFLFTDSMVTIHLIRKGIMRPWLLMGHEHEDTIKELLRKISSRGKVRAGGTEGGTVSSPTSGEIVRVHLHKVRAHTGVRGNEVADAFAKYACECLEDPQIQVAPGRVAVKKDFSFWVSPVGGGQIGNGRYQGSGQGVCTEAGT
jgi:ribonuclease HI